MFDEQTSPTPIPAEKIENSAVTKLEKPGSGKKPLIIGTIVGVILLAVAASASYYFFFREPNPQALFMEAWENTMAMQSGTSSYELELVVNPKGEQLLILQQRLQLTLSAVSEFNTGEDGKKNAKGELSLKIPVGTQLPFVPEVGLNPKLNFVALGGNDLYLQIWGIPEQLFGLDGLNGQWINLDLQEMQNSGFYYESSEESSEELSANLKKAYAEHPFIVFTRLDDEEVRGQKSYHYKLDLNKDEFKLFYAAASREVSKQLEEQGPGLVPEPPNNDFIDDLNIVSEVWISKKDRVITKMTASNLYEDENLATTVGLTMENYNFNQAVEITAPDGAISFAEAQQLIMGKILGSQEEQQITGDIRQIQTALELYYSSNGQYPLPPVGGQVLGVDANCLGEKGFVFNEEGVVNEDCVATYLSRLPAHPQVETGAYEYYLCSEDEYVITFDVLTEGTELSIGTHYATPDGIDVMGEEDLATKGGVMELKEDCFDIDRDGLSAYFETKYGTDPQKADTDGDGFVDGAEVQSGYNPAGEGTL